MDSSHEIYSYRMNFRFEKVIYMSSGFNCLLGNKMFALGNWNFNTQLLQAPLFWNLSIFCMLVSSQWESHFLGFLFLFKQLYVS